MALGPRVKLASAAAVGAIAFAWVLSRRPALAPADASDIAAKLAALREAREVAQRAPLEWDDEKAAAGVPLVVGDPRDGGVNAVVVVERGAPMGLDGGCLDSVEKPAPVLSRACADFLGRRLRFAVVVEELDRKRGTSGTFGSFDTSPTRPVFLVTVVDLADRTALRHFLFQASSHRSENATAEERARHARRSLEEALPQRVEGARFSVPSPP